MTFFENWEGDADRPDSPLIEPDLVDIEPTIEEDEPDDVANWSWNLDPEFWDGFDD